MTGVQTCALPISGEAFGVRNRVAGLDHGNAPGRAAIAVPGDGDAVDPVFRHEGEIVLFRDFDQRASGLAGGEDNEPPARRRLGQLCRQAARRVCRANCGPVQGFEEIAILPGQIDGPVVLATRPCGLYLSSN